MPDPAAILRVIRAIPRGCVASYGEIAERAGLPRRARLVGHVLRESPDEPELPWYRVLRSDGRIAFQPGSRGFREQVRRLAAEGVLVIGGRVDIGLHGWDRNLDRVLWAPPPPRKRTAASAPKSARSTRKR
ncbi:MAG TPA: MGMT family protein [Rhodanobacteraceae bacterium]|nr:MGMT family protein [Rhodanobacteraceae bacterium]